MRNHLFVGAAAIAIVMPAAAMAQETTSTIRGDVVGASGPIAGAEVTILHVPSGTTTSTTTDATGSFNAAGLRIGGPFTVTAAAGGETASVSEITLTAGQPLRLTIELGTPAADDIVVTGARNVREQSLGPITALTRAEIEGVASINRDIRDIARRDAFVTIDPSNSRTIEIAGQNGRLNRFSVDGVQFSDDFGLNNGGLPTNRGPVPFDAIEQLAVKVAPYDILEGDFQGGAINVVLRSGTNSFSGTGFYTYTDENLTGDRTRGTVANPSGLIDLNFKSEQYGGLLAGPLIRDKLFFMIAYEKTDESVPFDNGVGAGFANQVPGITLAEIDTVSTIAQNVFNYDTLGQLQNAIEEDEKIVAKLDANLGDNHRASLTYIRNVGTRQFQQNAFLTPVFALGLQSNGYELREEVNSGVFQLNSTWSDRFSTEVRVSYRDYNRDQTPFGGRDIAQFEVCLDPTSIASGANSITSCGSERIFFGPDISRQTNDLNQDNLSADIIGRFQAGNHAIKFNVGYTDIDTFNLFVQRSTGDLYFDSLADFQARRASRFRLGGSVSGDINTAAANFTGQTYTFGVQDDWEVTPALTLTLGARYDLFNNPEAVPPNANFLARNGFGNRSTFNGRGAFQPRFGFNWQAAERLIIRGGVGVFAGGTPEVFLSNSYSNTGLLTNAIDIARTTTAAGCNVTVGATAAEQAAFCAAALNGVTGANFSPAVLNFLRTNTASLSLAPVNAIDPDLDVASQLRATLSINYDADLGPLGEGWLFGADFLYGESIKGYQITDLRSVQAGTLPDGRPRYNVRPGVPATTNQDLLLTNSDLGRSYIGVARVSKRWNWGLTIDGSYTRSDIKDQSAQTSATAGSLYSNNAFLDPNFAAYGTSIYQIKDQWKFSIDFRRAFFGGDAETRFSLFGEYRTGRPYSLTFLDRATGRLPVLGTVGNGGRALLYVPTLTDPLVSFDSVATQTAFNNFVDARGLRRGAIVAKNSEQSPDFFKIDLHVSQQIPAFVGNAKVEVFADIENVLNLIDSDWGSLRQVSFPQTAAIVDVQCLPAAVATGTAATSGTLAQPCTQYRYSNFQAPNETLESRISLYQIRVGARFRF